jgi:hypothetical protein
MISGASNEDTDKAFGVFCRAYVSLIATGLDPPYFRLSTLSTMKVLRTA